MTVELIGVVALVLGLLGLFLESSFIVYVFFGSTLLGAAAALVLDALGNTTIQPAHLLLGFLTVKLLSNREVRAGTLKAMFFGTPGFWLLLTVGYATLTAYVMPRMFMGQTLVFAVRADQYYAAPLVPTTSNLTQSIYLIGDCVCFLILSGLGASDAGRKSLGRAAFMCVVLNLVFAALDLATYATGTADLMSFIRNSTYSILTDHEIAGFKRIIGSFVEASSFGYATLGYFAFTTSLWLDRISPRVTLSLSVFSFATLLFSTSTTAYVGLAVYLAFQLARTAVILLFSSPSPQRLAFLFGFPFLITVVIIAIALNDAAYSYFVELVNTMVLDKMSTASGIERSIWNTQALQNFFDTYGFGAGNGSVRASSFPVAVIASLGVPGAAIYAMYLLTLWFGKSTATTPDIHAMQRAARSACFAWFIAATASAGFIDLGLPFFSFAAVACAGRSARTRQSIPPSSARPLLANSLVIAERSKGRYL